MRESEIIVLDAKAAACVVGELQIARGETVLLGADERRHRRDRAAWVETPSDQPRGDAIKKMLVHVAARNKGVSAQPLM